MAKPRPKVLCSTGALGYRPDLMDSPWLAQVAPMLPCDGFELMIYSQWLAKDAMAGSLRQDQGLCFPVAHLAKGLGEHYSAGNTDAIGAGHAILRDNCHLARGMGARQGVLHLWSLPHSDDHFDGTLRALGQAMGIAAEYELELLVETLPCRNQPLMRRLKQIAQAFPACRFTADTRLLCCAGALRELMDCHWVWEQERIAHVHVSDCAVDSSGDPISYPILLPGQGIVDLHGFFQCLRRKGYCGTVTLESPAPRLPGGEADIAALAAPLRLIGDWLSG